jgi:hypothetical protein
MHGPFPEKGLGKFHKRSPAFHLPSGLPFFLPPSPVFLPAFHGFSGNRGNKKPGLLIESRA